ncbi:MAG: hypothetical protein R3F07_01755 [Opitutaceae bacterium]
MKTLSAACSRRTSDHRKPVASMLWNWRVLGLTCLLGWFPTVSGAASPGVDEHTLALWLFDEPTYPNVILTDAGPHGYDLRLQSAYGEWAVRAEGKGEPPARPLHVDGRYGLLPGKFGRALYVPDPSIARVIWPDNRQRYSSASMLGEVDQVPERLNLGYFDWTIEFWFKAEGAQPIEATVFEVRNEQDYPRGLPMQNALRLEPGRSSFRLVSETTMSTAAANGEPANTFRFELTVPTDADLLNDGSWHHLAFCFSAPDRQLRHFLDGSLQPLPGKGGFLPMIGVLKELTIGTYQQGWLDEYRISDTARYAGGFEPPEVSRAVSGQSRVRSTNPTARRFSSGRTKTWTSRSISVPASTCSSMEPWSNPRPTLRFVHSHR